MQEIDSESQNMDGRPVEVRIESGKLFYDKKWYHRGQPVYICNNKDGTRFSGEISVIADREVNVHT